MQRNANAQIIRNGRIAELRRAMKTYICKQCGETIENGNYYYAVVIGGGGLGSLKFPSRVHQECIETYLSK